MIDEGFRWFLGLVEQRRGIKPDQIPGLTRGRVFTGREAVQLKLVDSIGGEDEAVEWLRTDAQHRQKPEGGRLEAADIGLAWLFQLASAPRQRAFSTTPT